MQTTLLHVRTAQRLLTDLTAEIQSFCQGLGDGACHVFAPHATAGIALVELGSGTEEDLAVTLDRLLPTEVAYRHRHGSPGHGRDHVLPALVSPSLLVPVLDSRPALGTWQSVVLVDPNVDNHERQVRLSFLRG